MNKQKKPYTPPEIKKEKLSIKNTVLASNVENFSSYIDGTGDDWGEPIIDLDEPIDWQEVNSEQLLHK